MGSVLKGQKDPTSLPSWSRAGQGNVAETSKVAEQGTVKGTSEVQEALKRIGLGFKKTKKMLIMVDMVEYVERMPDEEICREVISGFFKVTVENARKGL